MAIEPSIVLSIKKDVFKFYLADYIRSLNSDKINLLQDINLFKEWERNQLSTLVQYLRSYAPLPGQFLYKEGDTNRRIYIILEGEFEILGKISPRVQTAHLLKENIQEKQVVLLRLKKEPILDQKKDSKLQIKNLV